MLILLFDFRKAVKQALTKIDKFISRNFHANAGIKRVGSERIVAVIFTRYDIYINILINYFLYHFKDVTVFKFFISSNNDILILIPFIKDVSRYVGSIADMDILTKFFTGSFIYYFIVDKCRF